jgi:serine protease
MPQLTRTLPRAVGARSAALAALLLVATASSAAERAPAPRPALAPIDGEVIVRFKADASVLRRHALAARAEAGTVRDVLVQRAGLLGGRTGHVLEAGGALGEREQVMRSATVPAAELARRLAADPDVEYAVPNGRRQALVAPNDPLYAATAAGVRPRGPDSGQWYLRAPSAPVVSSIDVETAWARTTGRSSVVVAVLDTGVRFDHPDLGRASAGGRLLPGYDFVSNATVGNDGSGRDDDPSDPGDWVTSAETNTSTFRGCSAEASSWHGTSTASLIGAATNNAAGMAGVAPGVGVLPVRVLGKCYGVDSDIIAGMRWAAGIAVDGVPANPNPAKVLNMSLGGTGACSSAYQNAVNEIVARGVIIVAAAGNGAGGAVGVPANCRGVIAVLGLRHVGSKVGFSDLGPEVAIAAPGGNCININAGEPCLYPMLAATNTGTQGPVASAYSDSFNITVGTSFASPMVAGVVGLMASQQASITPASVRSILQSTARPFPTTGADNGTDPTPVTACVAPQNNVEQLQCYCTTALCGAGMLDAGRAVAAVSAVIARVTVTTAAPTAGSPVLVSAADSSADTGRSIVAWAWQIVDAGGTGAALTSAANAATATIATTAAGTFSLRLTVTDDLGRSASSDQAVVVAAAPAPPVTNPPATGGGGGGGGGGMAVGWVALLGLATALLLRGRRHSPGR